MMCYDPCPAGYVGAGTMCWLGFASTMRGIGTFMTCSSSDKDYQFGWCYDACPSNTVGTGPVCWGNCPNGYSECGTMLCMESAD